MYVSSDALSIVGGSKEFSLVGHLHFDRNYIFLGEPLLHVGWHRIENQPIAKNETLPTIQWVPPDSLMDKAY